MAKTIPQQSKLLKNMRVNQRVRFKEDSVEGTVIDVGYCAITVQWDDGQTGQIPADVLDVNVELA
jgi:hypothetical protein